MRKSIKTTVIFIILHTSEIFLTTLFRTSFKVETEKVHFSKSLHSTFNETVTLDILSTFHRGRSSENSIDAFTLIAFVLAN